jgi:hypothetical protein
VEASLRISGSAGSCLRALLVSKGNLTLSRPVFVCEETFSEDFSKREGLMVCGCGSRGGASVVAEEGAVDSAEVESRYSGGIARVVTT